MPPAEPSVSVTEVVAAETGCRPGTAQTPRHVFSPAPERRWVSGAVPVPLALEIVRASASAVMIDVRDDPGGIGTGPKFGAGDVSRATGGYGGGEACSCLVTHCSLPTPSFEARSTVLAAVGVRAIVIVEIKRSSCALIAAPRPS